MKIQFLLPVILITSLTACDESHSSSTQPPAADAKPTKSITTSEPGTEQPTTSGNTTVTNPIVSTPEAQLLGLRSGLSINQSEYLKSLGSAVALHSENFQSASEALERSAEAYCASYDPAALASLQARFKDAMLIWEQLELYQMGPLTENNSNLKMKIYGWPQLSNYCKIDSESLAAASDGEFVLSSVTNRKGLQALEYLIFDKSLVSVCPKTNPTKTEWEALTPEKKWEARCAYIKPLTKELVGSASELRSAWGTPSDNYVSRVVGNEAGEQSVLQEIFNQIFYIDIEMKNQKIAAVAGQDPLYCNKSPSPCPDKDELHYSQLSTAALKENIRAVSDILFGYGEPRQGGLTALLRNKQGLEAADRSEQKLAQLVNLSETQNETLESLIASKQNENCDLTQNSWFCKMRSSIKDIVSEFKGEYSSVLKVQVPLAPAGDND